MTKLLNQVKKKQSLYRKKLQGCEEKLASRKSYTKSKEDWCTSEQYEEIRELQASNIALKDSLDDTEKKLDHVKSLNRGESQVKRLSQLSWECSETVKYFTGSRWNFENPEIALSEVS